MPTWQAFPAAVPSDGQTVWVRMRSWFGPPFLAVWTLDSKTFKSVENDLEFPWYIANRWKPIE